MQGEVGAGPGWDGDSGPFLVTVDGNRFVDASNPMRADQTRAALAGHVGFSGLDMINTNDFIRRMEALRWCRQHIQADGFNVGAAWIIHFEAVGDWATWTSAVWPPASPELAGPGMIFLFAATHEGTEEGTPPLRRRFPVQRTLEVHMSGVLRFSDLTLVLEDEVKPSVFVRLDGQPFVRVASPPAAPPPAESPFEAAPAAGTSAVAISRDTRLPQ
jgi:hypothetical protein